MAKQLLVDTLNIRLRMEEGKNGGKLIARGQFALADKKTANNRVYGRKLWEREINRMNNPMRERKIFGQLDHPDDGRTKLSRVCHLLTNMTVQEDGQVVGEAEILDTTMGRELKAILEGGGSVGVSSRGYGSVKANDLGEDVVQDDFQLDTFDFVVDPAQGTAYPDFTAESAPKPAGLPLADHAKVEVEEAISLQPAAAPEARPAARAESAPKVEAAKSDALGALDWASLPEGLRKEFSARVMVAVTEAKDAIRSELKAELSADPAVAGAKEALESVKAILRPYVIEADTSLVLEAKEREIALLKERLAKQEGFTRQVSEQNGQLNRAVKDLAFNLYLQKTLADHPRFREVTESLGELSDIPSLSELKNRVKIFESEIVKMRTDNKQTTRKLLSQRDDQIKSLGEQLTKLTANNRKIAGDRDAAIAKANESLSQVYLERKIYGNPNASRIRVAFEKQESKSKQSVDNLVESFAARAPQRGDRDFERVRARMTGTGNGRLTNLVENALQGTVPAKAQAKIHVAEGLDLGIQEFESLAGIRG